MKLIDRANELLREAYIRKAQRENWTGWKNQTVDSIQHVRISEPDIIAALDAIEERLAAIEAGMTVRL